MTRDIRFRFWDKTTNTMIYPIENYETICIIDGKLKPVLSNSIVDNWNWYKREYEPLQYIGLKDMNGKDIYEGDIVDVISDGNLYAYIVVFDLDELDFKATNGNEHYKTNYEYLPCCDEIEVIGNIYENPNLKISGR